MLVTHPIFNLDQNTRTDSYNSLYRTSENAQLLLRSLSATTGEIEENTEISMNILIHAHKYERAHARARTHVHSAVQIIIVYLLELSHSAYHRLYALKDVSLNDM